MLIKIASLPSRAAFYGLTKNNFTPPEDIIALMQQAFVGFATVWQRAG
ncbi:MAG: hypothetical protein KDJ65_19615 [Anaerolineae bacterium]|nr:hypothetical protein [Anaerolineae bacterium]